MAGMTDSSVNWRHVSMRMFLQDGIGFAYQGHKIVIELVNGDENDLTGQTLGLPAVTSISGTCRSHAHL